MNRSADRSDLIVQLLVGAALVLGTAHGYNCSNQPWARHIVGALIAMALLVPLLCVMPRVLASWRKTRLSRRQSRLQALRDNLLFFLATFSLEWLLFFAITWFSLPGNPDIIKLTTFIAFFAAVMPFIILLQSPVDAICKAWQQRKAAASPKTDMEKDVGARGSHGEV